MIYLAGIYVALCGAQFAFMVWRDLKETRRRESVGDLSRKYSEQASKTEARMATAMEGLRAEMASFKRGAK